VHKPSRFMLDLFGTAFSQFLVVVLSVLTTRLIAEIVSQEELGILMIVRRTISFLLPLISLNIGAGLARYLAYMPAHREQFSSFSVWFVVGISSGLLLLFVVLRQQLALMLFGDLGHANYIIVLAISLISAMIIAVIVDMFRGSNLLSHSNTFQVIVAVVSLFAVPMAWGGSRVTSSETFLLWYLYLSALVGLGVAISYFLLFRPRFLWMRPIPWDLQILRPFALYSVVRVPGHFLSALVFSMPLLIAGKSGSLQVAASIGILITLVRLLELVAYPFNFIVLPKFAALNQPKSIAELNGYANLILDFIVRVLPAIGALSFGMAGNLLELMFGGQYRNLAGYGSVLLLFSCFYMACILLRGIWDGMRDFPYGAVVAAVGIIPVLVTNGILNIDLLQSLVIGLSISMVLMGITSFIVVYLITRATISAWAIMSGLIVMLIMLGGCYLADLVIDFIQPNLVVSLFLQVAARIMFFYLIFSIYWKKQTIWGGVLLDRLGAAR
jgi:O-antigen/teichoic acid export membrane protein